MLSYVLGAHRGTRYKGALEDFRAKRDKEKQKHAIPTT